MARKMPSKQERYDRIRKGVEKAPVGTYGVKTLQHSAKGKKPAKNETDAEKRRREKKEVEAALQAKKKKKKKPATKTAKKKKKKSTARRT